MTAPKESLEGYLRRWLEDVAPLSCRPITLESYESKLRNHVYPKLGRVTLTELQPMQLSGLYAGMQRKGLSKRTIQYVRAILHKALEDTVTLNILPYNVASRVKVAPPEPKDMAVIEPEDLEKVCDAMEDDWLYPYFYLAIATGCRRGELCALKWEDVDWHRPAIRIDESTQELPKKKGGILYGIPKSKTSRRVVLLPQEAVNMLRLQRKRQEKLRSQLGDRWQGDTFVFTNKKGKPLRPSTVSHHWKLIRERFGIGDVVLHGLRHTHATMLLKYGVQPKVVMERLGHSTIAIGQNLYSKVIKSMQDEVKDQLEQLMPKAKEAK